MAVAVSSLGVSIEELTPGAPTQGVGTSTAAFLGPARAGAYTLMACARGYQPGGGLAHVPAPGGVYDVALAR